MKFSCLCLWRCPKETLRDSLSPRLIVATCCCGWKSLSGSSGFGTFIASHDTHLFHSVVRVLIFHQNNSDFFLLIVLLNILLVFLMEGFSGLKFFHGAVRSSVLRAELKVVVMITSGVNLATLWVLVDPDSSSDHDSTNEGGDDKGFDVFLSHINQLVYYYIK